MEWLPFYQRSFRDNLQRVVKYAVVRNLVDGYALIYV